ncbi:hypothetical protein [Anaerovibrio sp. JC8]|uniref:hypothetical protein n=1 Tax=Anaerovibrio sp. JC8 TaxID=1240085 RepID=UPI000A102C7A|nr:hypothetical protein [Anaerovibrio sp. JC8]
MYCVKYEYGEAGRFFLTLDEIEKEICYSVYIEDFTEFISKPVFKRIYGTCTRCLWLSGLRV